MAQRSFNAGMKITAIQCFVLATVHQWDSVEHIMATCISLYASWEGLSIHASIAFFATCR
jgi:hypothetical protein